MNFSFFILHSSLPRRVNPSRREGFTLLEMLVVIVVMALLMGVTFRMLQPSEEARRLSNTVKILNLTTAAIAEYHAEYGIYPPVVDEIQYGGVTGGLNVEGNDDNQNKCGFVPGVSVAFLAPTAKSFRTADDFKLRDSDNVFCFGLVAYLVDCRDPKMEYLPGSKNHGTPWIESVFKGANEQELKKYFAENSWWYKCRKGVKTKGTDVSLKSDKLYELLAPSDKDVAFYKRIRNITAKIVSSKGNNNSSTPTHNYNYFTIRDDCRDDGQDLVYICPPPFTSYALFSAGADGKVVTEDPLNPDAVCEKCGGYHNQDNVYPSVNMK